MWCKTTAFFGRPFSLAPGGLRARTYVRHFFVQPGASANCTNGSRNICAICLLYLKVECGIIIVSRGERNKPLLGLSPSEVKLGTPHKKHERTCRKPLDKLHKVWYNDNVKRGYTPFETDRHQLQNGKQIGRKWKVKPKIFFQKL